MARRRLEYASAASPLGELLVVASERGIVRLAFPEEEPTLVLEEVAADLGAGPVSSPSSLRAFGVELQEYFGRRRTAFETALDLSLVRGFVRRSLEAAAAIPYGRVATYGEMAARAGSPRAARAAGNAMRHNPVPILVPCHRVVPADGSIGGYGGQEERKAWLLDLEATP